VSELAYQRISGQVNDTWVREAARWYEQYRTVAPYDLLGLKRLAVIYQSLGRPEALTLREELEAKTDNRRIVAEALNVPVESVELGTNLAENGGFELWVNGRPEAWVWSDMATGDPWNRGTFAGGNDKLNAWDGQAARLDGLWLQQKPGKEAGRCGYWHMAIPLEPDALYLVAFFYRTARHQGERSSLWLSYQGYNLFAGDYFLPDTAGVWRKFAVIGWNKPGEVSAIQPLLRSWGSGEFEFDAVEVRKVTLKGDTVSPDMTTRFILR